MNSAADLSHFAKDVSAESFADDVLQASFQQPVLVDFWAPWCGPCKTLKPMLEKLAEEYQGRFLLAKVNSDENQELAAHFQVRSIPTVKAFINGEMIDEFMGALPEPQLRAFIDRLLPSPVDPLRAEAAELWHDGQAEAALAKLIEASSIDPDHEGVRLDAVQLLLALGRPDDARPLLDLEYKEEAGRAQALRAQLALAGTEVDTTALEARITANPRDHAARLELAKGLAAVHRYEEAFEQCLESLLRDKTYNDGEARRTMLQFFDLLAADPMNDDLIRHYRRQLSAALN